MSAAKRVKLEDNDYTLPWEQSDVIFEVENQKLYFNRAVLSFHSEVFERMFNAEFRESDPEKPIPLPEKKFDDVQAMLFALKSRPEDLPSPITNENLHALLVMSDEYQMQHLAAECERFIRAKWRPVPTKHIEAVQLAFKYGMKGIAKVFLPLAACRRLAEIDAAADALRAEVYAAILHGNATRSQSAAAAGSIVRGAASFDACETCGFYKIQSARQCQCTRDAPVNDPMIKAVLENFAEISQKMT